MSSSYLKNDSENVYDLNTERKLRQYILDTIKSFRKNRELSNVSRGYNPRSESSEEGSDDDSDLWVNTNHNLKYDDVSDESKESEKALSKRDRLERDRLERDRLEKDRLERDRLERDRLEKARLVSEDRSENGINFWKTNAFKKWLIRHNRLLKHYMSEGTLHNEAKRWNPHAMHYDIGIWKYLIDENYMANLHLDYSKDNFTKLYRLYQKNKESTRYNQSNEKILLFIHMYLREAFLARHELRNIDFRKKLCLLADERKLVYLSGDKDKKRYIRTPEFYYQAPYNYYPSSYQTYEEKCVIFDIPQNQELLRKEYTIATGYDNILEEVMDMILLARERNISTPLTTTEFASQLLTLKPDQIHTIHKKLQKILLE
jgi:hypothetical protein